MAGVKARAKRLHHPFSTRRVRLMLATFVALTAAVGLLITPIERASGHFTTFTTTGDGLWWAITTVTSVGYGDYYPVTTPGRVLGAILEVGGVMTFGVIIALVTVNLLRGERQFYWKRTVERFDRLERHLTKLEKKVSFEVKSQSRRDPGSRQG